MALDPVLVENTSAWLQKAEEDLQRVGRSLSADPPDVEDALFHSQQAATALNLSPPRRPR